MSYDLLIVMTFNFVIAIPSKSTKLYLHKYYLLFFPVLQTLPLRAGAFGITRFLIFFFSFYFYFLSSRVVNRADQDSAELQACFVSSNLDINQVV